MIISEAQEFDSQQPTNKLDSTIQLIMFTQKQLPSVQSTAVRPEQEERIARTPQKWKQLEAKYLKYIALLKSKADKSKKRIDQNNKYIQLALFLKYKIQNKMMNAFRNIQFNNCKPQTVNDPKQTLRTRRAESFHKQSKFSKQFENRVQEIICKNLRSAFLVLKTVSQQNSNYPRIQYSQSSPQKQSSKKNLKHISAIKQLQKLQSSILTFSQTSNNSQVFQLQIANSKLKQQIIVSKQEVARLKQELEFTNQRMETELLKKSLALMESEIDGQQKQELIKQYQIQLQCRTTNNNKVLLFTLQDFEIERQRLQTINQKLFKEFQNTKQTFIQEIKNQNMIINELKSKLGRTSITLTQTNVELESLRAYKFQNQYQKQCERYKGVQFYSSPKLSIKRKPSNPAVVELLNYIQNILSKEGEFNKAVYVCLNQTEIAKLQSIEEKLHIITHQPNNVFNKIIRINSLQRSVAFEQNVKVSNQQLNSFLDVFQSQQHHLSIDSRVQQQLENKVLSLNERLFNIRELILTLLQSIQIRNPPKELLNLIENIYDVFQFSQPEKESFYGGRKSLFQRLFS